MEGWAMLGHQVWDTHSVEEIVHGGRSLEEVGGASAEGGKFLFDLGSVWI